MTSTIMIIPARAGSKGVPKKNIRELAGVPLIGHLINAALASKSIDEVYVSTDGQDIAEVAQSYGAAVIQRPYDISGDFVSSEVAVLHALGSIKFEGGQLPERTFFAQCTSPLTKPEDFDSAMNIMDHGNFDCVFTAKAFHGFIWRLNSDGEMQGINHDYTARRLMRQERGREYHETGAFYLMNSQGFLINKHRFFGKVGVCEIPAERCIDIDTLEDFETAAKILDKIG